MPGLMMKDEPPIGDLIAIAGQAPAGAVVSAHAIPMAGTGTIPGDTLARRGA